MHILLAVKMTMQTWKLVLQSLPTRSTNHSQETVVANAQTILHSACAEADCPADSACPACVKVQLGVCPATVFGAQAIAVVEWKTHPSVVSFHKHRALYTAFINPEDLDKLWMEAPQSKAKPAKPAAKQEEQLPQQQQQQQQQPASLEQESSHEGFVDHAGDTLDDAAAAGEITHDCPGVNEHGFYCVLAVAPGILGKPTRTYPLELSHMFAKARVMCRPQT